MKLIIDIDEQIWNMVVNTGTFGCYRFNTSRAIRKGVPLDKIRAEILNFKEKCNASDYLGCGILEIIDKYRGNVDEN